MSASIHHEGRVAELEKELQYYKEMYEIEKETNELNDIKLKEMDTFNAQDRQRYERELNELRAKYRRLEMSTNNQKESESANQVFRQRIRQLELEAASLTDRVRIAENLATKYEEDCRAKDFKISEQQKEYEVCLSKCNALELMLMTNSQMDGSFIMGQSMIADASDSASDTVNGRHLNSGEYIEKRLTPNTDTTSDTAPQSPVASYADVQNPTNSLNGSVKNNGRPHSLQLNNNQATSKELQSPTDSLPNFADMLDIGKARKYCESHANDVDSLLKFADMVRAVRFSSQSSDSRKPGRLSDSSGRIPLAVATGMDYLKDLQRHFSELAANKYSRPGA